MHEFVLSGEWQKEQGVNTLGIAKRLMDSNFHPPTIYFPLIVHEAIMIEPTESETKERLDEFIDTMIKIADEIKENPQEVLLRINIYRFIPLLFGFSGFFFFFVSTLYILFIAIILSFLFLYKYKIRKRGYLKWVTLYLHKEKFV